MSDRLALRVVQALFVLLALGVVIGFARAARDGEHRRAPDAVVKLLAPSYTGDNRLAPDFDLPDRTGQRHRLSELRGKTVVLHFFSRTCGPCVDELQRSIPTFDEILRDRHDIAFVIVSVDANWDAIAPLVPNGLRTPILFDPDRSVVSGKYGTQLFPETWVIDPRGVIRARFDHTIEWDSSVLVDYLASLR